MCFGSIIVSRQRFFQRNFTSGHLVLKQCLGIDTQLLCQGQHKLRRCFVQAQIRPRPVSSPKHQHLIRPKKSRSIVPIETTLEQHSID